MKVNPRNTGRFRTECRYGHGPEAYRRYSSGAPECAVCRAARPSRYERRLEVDRGARFWARVDSSAGPDGCWPFTKSQSTGRGYGGFSFGGKMERAPRVAYELAYGAIPEGLYVCHRCDNPPCCNPAHLFPGTPADNTRDAVAKGHFRRTLTLDQAFEVAAARARGESLRVIARRYGVDHSTLARLPQRPSYAAAFADQVAA